MCKPKVSPSRPPLSGLVCLAPLLSACALPTTPAPPLTVPLPWRHLAPVAGSYAADQKGNYAGEGLAATSVQRGGEVDKLVTVLEGKAQFGVAAADTDQSIVARTQGKRLRAVTVVYRRSPPEFFSLAGSGTTRPQHFVGKSIR